MPQSVMIIAGEASGDEHASHVIRKLREQRPGLECFGIGGPLMASEGFSPLMPFEPFNRMGVGEVLASLPFFMKAKRGLVARMARSRPGVLVLIDYAGFNIPMLKAAHRLRIPTLWYIAPKVWAWKKNRARVLGRYAHTVATILPFEPAYFEGHAAQVCFVGNPCVEELERKHKILSAPGPRREPPKGRPWRLALVPGSRRQEIVRILPSMAGAAALLRARHGFDVKISLCRGLDRNLFSPYLQTHELETHEGPLDELLAWSDLALVTSGTATLQAALMGVPHVLVYKMSLINQIVFNYVVNIPFIGLPNIIAGKEIIRECLQKQAGSEPLSAEIERFVNDGVFFETTITELEHLRGVLGTKVPSEEVSRLALNILDSRL